jgi:hypothetical protein
MAKTIGRWITPPFGNMDIIMYVMAMMPLLVDSWVYRLNLSATFVHMYSFRNVLFVHSQVKHQILKI